jgi:hypothetical protein
MSGFPRYLYQCSGSKQKPWNKAASESWVSWKGTRAAEKSFRREAVVLTTA